ncbi:MAG TPA: hypothetical protein VLL25_00740 [Acidimicrobiales bacterium]|nr:hypothetical protein [Acidimicrobiales bacterium]
MRTRTRWLTSAVGIAALTVPILSGASAGATNDKPETETVNILGGDHFVRPGLLVNNFRFDDENIVVEQGSRITFRNMTTDGHTIALVTDAALPKTTAEVDNCENGTGGTVCDAVNGVFYGQGGPMGPPLTPQIDNGKATDDDTQADADTPDPAAIGIHLPPGFPPVLVEDFDTRGTATTVGDATTTAPPGRGPTERTVVMTGAPGLYHYMCTLHPWMQGTIRVVK